MPLVVQRPGAVGLRKPVYPSDLRQRAQRPGTKAHGTTWRLAFQTQPIFIIGQQATRRILLCPRLLAPVGWPVSVDLQRSVSALTGSRLCGSGTATRPATYSMGVLPADFGSRSHSQASESLQTLGQPTPPFFLASQDQSSYSSTAHSQSLSILTDQTSFLA